MTLDTRHAREQTEGSPHTYLQQSSTLRSCRVRYSLFKRRTEKSGDALPRARGTLFHDGKPVREFCVRVNWNGHFAVTGNRITAWFQTKPTDAVFIEKGK